MTSQYWKDRQALAQASLTKKNIKQIEKQLKIFYGDAMRRMSGSFLYTYRKIELAKEKGLEPTTADLYKLDSYWKLQGQLQQELTKLGDKQAELYRKQFVKQWHDIYNSFALKDSTNYSHTSDEAVLKVISEIWCADGKSWSQRIWDNTNKLQEALNDELVHCVLTGADSKYLRQMLMTEFNVSYGRADSLIRTELSHIQNQAAAQRYKDAGVKQFEVYVDEDERTCPICAKHEGEKYYVNDRMPVPFHPRCRCCILPVID